MLRQSEPILLEERHAHKKTRDPRTLDDHGPIGGGTMMAAEQPLLRARGYKSNTGFLDAMLKEAILQLECGGLRRLVRQRSRRRWCSGLYIDPEGAIPTEELRQRLDTSERELLRLGGVSEARLEASDPQVVPFLDLVRRCRLTPFDRQVLLLLFFRAVSPEFLDHYEELPYEQLEPGTRGHAAEQEVRIRTLLEILCSSGIGRSFQALARFRADAPLIDCHLLRMGGVNEQRPSILDVEVHLRQRVLSWIGGDTLSFPGDDPCPEE